MTIRDELIQSLEREIVGPAPNEYYLDEATNEEILIKRIHGDPHKRYGAGILFPKSSTPVSEEDSETAGENGEEPVMLANQYKPSAMGFTVRFRKDAADDQFTLRVNAARYEAGTDTTPMKKLQNGAVTENGTSDRYWIRKPLNIDPQSFHLREFLESETAQIKDKPLVVDPDSAGSKQETPWLKLQIFKRSSDEEHITLTFTITNEKQLDPAHLSRDSLFQCGISLSTESPELLAPFDDDTRSNITEDEEEFRLLYRKKQVFSIGHGISVSWDDSSSKDDEGETVKHIYTSVLPTYEIPQVSPSGSDNLDLSMYHFARDEKWEETKQTLTRLAEEYGAWISEIENKAETQLEESYKKQARANIDKCKNIKERIERGINLLDKEQNPDLVWCFQLMNDVMIWQQQRSRGNPRQWQIDDQGNLIQPEPLDEDGKQEFDSLKDYYDKSDKNGRWFPFQLAFILMNIESLVHDHSNEREIVDLIWFPTGGGKTEAYLGLAALTIFFRRAKGARNGKHSHYSGTAVIMRYTLRLLTTQQYERAASLIAACELTRRHNYPKLGPDVINIGLWVGSNNTPNDNSQARGQYDDLTRSQNAAYNFVVMKCPCCGSQIGKTGNRKRRIVGLRREKGSVYLNCENTNCELNGPLPLEVIDANIYKNPPTLLFGTVDKFAMITWKAEAGSIFGFRDNNNTRTRIAPPELIIQDELHLISGPLGTMVGLYENMVVSLCYDYKNYEPPFLPENPSDATARKPKIVASTATISRSKEQVQSLYGTSRVSVFPQQGLEFGESWFSEKREISEEYPGRKYLGLLAPGYPSMQTAIVRAYAAVLQKASELRESKAIDYYWTLMGYFNSIRELGGARSLVSGDVVERLKQVQNRELISNSYQRRIRENNVRELTSRMDDAQIPVILKELENSFSQNNNAALDICLATNMVATGVDISRLGMMFIHGQPKTNAEYIQASSRVGRDLPEGPGLVVTLYSPSKPRDKSHYEQFQGYHSRIYERVEPTSVTPFSISSREKGLHAVFIGLVRHFASGELKNTPNPAASDEFNPMTEKVKNLLLERCRRADSREYEETESEIDEVIRIWRAREFQYYGDAMNMQYNYGRDVLMMARTGESDDEERAREHSFPTLTSMRGVSSESEVNVT